MKRYKKFIIGLIAISSLSACSDSMLSLTDPNRESSDTFWQKEEQYVLGLNSSYSVFRLPGYFSRFYHVLHTLRSDEGHSTSPAPEWHAYGNFILAPYNTDGTEGITLPWKVIYSQLYYVNQLIDNMNTRGFDIFGTNNNIEKANEIMGQAYFIRATAFWYLATTYGKGPLQLSSTTYGNIAEQLEIYNQALADYERAAPLLPKKWVGQDVGRFTKGGAIGMQARIHAQIAGYYTRPQNRDNEQSQMHWTLAKKCMEDLFELNDNGKPCYALVANYVDNFTDLNENNEESIVEIQFKEGLFNGKELGAHRPKFFGLFLQSGEGAWDDASAREWLLDEYELDKDGNVDKRRFYTLFSDKDNLSDPSLYYGKTYATWKAGGDLLKPCYWRKYTSVDSDPNRKETYSSGINFRFLRLADLYLLYAEALNALNADRTTAVEYINKVRRRANMQDLDAANFMSYDQLMAQIKHERLVELCGENVRWLDLDRWGDIHSQEGINILSERDSDFKSYRLGISHLYCIPNHEISLYPGLTQNSGY